MPLKHRNQFQKIADRNNEPLEFRETKILKQKDFYMLMQEIWGEHKGKTKVRKMLLEKRSWEHFVDSAAHQACPRVLCLPTTKVTEMQL